MTPEFKSKLREIVLKQQDYKQFTYADINGDLRIGFNHNLSQRGVSLNQALEFLADDLTYYTSKLNHYLTIFNDLSEARQIALIALCHFIGWQNVVSQRDLLTALDKDAFLIASQELNRLGYDDLAYLMISNEV